MTERRATFSFRVLFLFAGITVLAASTPSTAQTASVASSDNVQGDVHSGNMQLVSTLDSGHGGDLAFWGKTAVLSHGSDDGDTHARNDGFWLVDISNPSKPRKISEFSCSGSGYDVSVWKDLVFLSVDSDAATEGTACDAPPAEPNSENAFSGLRIVSIADPMHPRQVATVATPCGSHTHTIVPDLDHRDASDRPAPRLLIYVVKCFLTVVEVPLRNPELSHALPSSHPTGCHDVTVLLARRLAACAGFVASTELWDISDPVNPEVLSVIKNPAIENNHSTAFSWDGEVLVLGDEKVTALLGGHCYGGTSSPNGALWFYGIEDPRQPVLRSFYQLPRAVPGGCTAHNFNVVPLRTGKDILVSEWYRGGTTVVDFTDPSKPTEIAYYVAEPGDPVRGSNAWSSYWYNGHVYSNNANLSGLGPLAPVTERGLDIFSVSDALVADAVILPHLNAQTQEPLP